jgi:hypothetical protein
MITRVMGFTAKSLTAPERLCNRDVDEKDLPFERSLWIGLKQTLAITCCWAYE